MVRVGLKDFRLNMNKYARRVERGESFIIMRRTQILFKIVPVDQGQWEEVIDFTKLRKGGINIKELLKRL